MTLDDRNLLDQSLLDPEAVGLLDREIDDLLLKTRGLALVRDLLIARGATTDEVDAHSRELERDRARLAGLIAGGPALAA